MATTTTTGSSVPIKILHEAEGHIVTVELKCGEVYRGTLVESEDTMNCQLKDVYLIARDGRVSKIEQVFVRGGQIKFIVVPDILKNAPILKKIQSMKSALPEETPTKGKGRTSSKSTSGGSRKVGKSS